jgi:hypothetical protein
MAIASTATSRSSSVRHGVDVAVRRPTFTAGVARAAQISHITTHGRDVRLIEGGWRSWWNGAQERVWLTRRHCHSYTARFVSRIAIYVGSNKASCPIPVHYCTGVQHVQPTRASCRVGAASRRVGSASRHIDREGHRRRKNGVKSCSAAAARPGRSRAAPWKVESGK